MIPDNVKILGINYSVNQVEYISKEEFRLGQIDFVHSDIKLLSDLSEPKKEQTLWHEIMHAILNALELNYTDEESVQAISSVLHQVIKDNPKLFL